MSTVSEWLLRPDLAWCCRSWYHVVGSVAAPRRGEYASSVDVHLPRTCCQRSQQFTCQVHFPFAIRQLSSPFACRNSVNPPVTNFISGSSNDVCFWYPQHVVTPRLEHRPVVVCHVLITYQMFLIIKATICTYKVVACDTCFDGRPPSSGRNTNICLTGLYYYYTLCVQIVGFILHARYNKILEIWRSSGVLRGIVW